VSALLWYGLGVPPLALLAGWWWVEEFGNTQEAADSGVIELNWSIPRCVAFFISGFPLMSTGLIILVARCLRLPGWLLNCTSAFIGASYLNGAILGAGLVTLARLLFGS
jgi:hypothetical protein